MRRPRLTRSALSMALALTLALPTGVSRPSRAACPALSGSAELELSGGHDDNLMLTVARDTPGTLSRLGGGYGALSPLLAAVCAGAGFGLRLALLGDYRRSREVGILASHGAGLRGWFPRWGRLRLQLGASAGAFLASGFPEDEYLHAGGEAALAIDLSDEVSLRLAGGASRRHMRAAPSDGSAAGRDWLITPELRLDWQPVASFAIAAMASLLDVRVANDSAATFRRWRGGLESTLLWHRVTFLGQGWTGRLSYAGANETHVGARLEARLDLGPHIELFASAELDEPVSAGASRDYAHRVVSLGLSVRASHQRARARAIGPELHPRLEGDRVRFRLSAPAADAVTLLGSWDNWALPGRPLAPVPGNPPGLWELTTPLPPGAHRYHFLVDGKPRRPPDAIRYVADDFGSEDGVVEIPGETATSASTPGNGPP